MMKNNVLNMILLGAFMVTPNDGLAQRIGRSPNMLFSVSYKEVIFNGSRYSESPDLDKEAIYLMEQVAEGSDDDAVDAMLYLMWNYYVGPLNELKIWRNRCPQSARYVGPKDLKKSRYYLEKILANEKATDLFVDWSKFLSDFGMEREGAEECLNELNRIIGDRPYRDLTNGLSKKIVGRWKMSIYDGITSFYTFNSNGTFTAHHSYRSPQLKQGYTIRFDTTGKWLIEGRKNVRLTTMKRYLNLKGSYTGPLASERAKMKKMLADKDFFILVVNEVLQNSSGGVHYIGWSTSNYLSVSEINSTLINGDFETYRGNKKVRLLKVK